MERFFAEAERLNPEAVKSAKKILSSFMPNIIVNRVRRDSDLNTGKVVQELLKKYISLGSRVLTGLPEDRAVIQSIYKLRPVIVENPISDFSIAVERLCETILNGG